MLYQISSVTVEADCKLQLSYSNGETVTVDFSPIIKMGGAFTQLQDYSFFSQVTIGEGGRYIEWPGELEFCADALWLDGQHEGRRAGNITTMLVGKS